MKKEFLINLGFKLKDNSIGVYFKKYQDNTTIEVDFDKETINFGGKIKIYDKEIQNITKPEDRVVFECVDRLLEKGYNSKDILLEKVYPTGRGTSGRLDILVMKDKKAFLMIECKTWGTEYEKEYKKMQRDGGQLFTYFQQDRDSEFLILYTSNFNGKNIEYKNEIVTIEESYRETSNVEDLYMRWSKLTKNNGVFERRVNPYNFESKALIYENLKNIEEQDASKIFNRFLEILRHNTVSDKPNAFNKMFTLFLCKIYDELDKDGTNKELEFQWIEGKDSHVSFQVRLNDLYKRGMEEFLRKQVTDFSDEEFYTEFGSFIEDEKIKEKLLEKIRKLRLQKNNEFAIKEVVDEESFEENAKVLKEVVQLLEGYKLRYAKKQPFLGDFFELLLTTGLKQEAGQFFTPVPIARFICKSIPIENIINEKINNGNISDILPNTIDYAAGSGHFIIEAMEEIQNIISSKNIDNYNSKIKELFKNRKDIPYNWAGKYMYGIENDYRLVRTSKVGCYLHGDGIATVIHGDGLDNFQSSKTYVGKLKESNTEYPQDNEQFDLLLSNPPYSISAFKSNIDREQGQKDFNLYENLTENSSEIEALFIERTKQLLKEGGIAAIILPSSILNNSGIYTKAREIILRNFEIISIVSLGSGTFMATGTNTVVLFMRKRNRFFTSNIEKSVNKFFTNLIDVSLNSIENVFSKYVQYVWGISFEDYKTLIQKAPNEIVKKHELYLEYTKKKKNDEILEIEKEKIVYFILSYNQSLVLVKSGEKQVEKDFLGYEFSTRKGSEGIHAIKGGKKIDDCTKLFDSEIQDNPEKVSTYIYDGFNNKFDRNISDNLSNHISRRKLIDLLTFDRIDFEKTISTNVKKKFNIESKWESIKIENSIDNLSDNIIKIQKKEVKSTGMYPVISQEKDKIIGYTDLPNPIQDLPLVIFGDHNKVFKYIDYPFFVGADGVKLLKPKNIFIPKYFYSILESIKFEGKQEYQRHYSILKDIKIPVPPKDIQEKIVSEIGILEREEKEKKEKVENFENEIEKIILGIEGEKQIKIGEIKEELFAGGDLPEGNYIKGLKETEEYKIPIYSNGLENDGLYGFTNKARVEKECVTISARGTIGFPIERKQPFYPIVRLLVLIPKKDLALNKYLVYVIKKLDLNQFGLATPQLTVPQISDFKIPLPTLETQKQIVSEIEKIESEIEILERDLKSIPEKKKEVLKKYL